MRFFPAALAGFALAFVGSAQSPACRTAAGPEIQGRDLAAAIPSLSSLPADLAVAPMPLPGASRTLHSVDILALGRRHAISLDAAPELCFQWAMEPLKSELMLAAMRSALQVSEAKIEIIDASRQLVPPGTIEFPVAKLSTPALPTVRVATLWRGDVIYGGGQRYGIWANVRISVPCERVIAAEPLAAAKPIAADQIQISQGECFPTPGKPALSGEQVVGMMLLRSVAQGAEIRPNLITPPNDVNRGQNVEVRVLSGGARLEFIAKAETAGRVGDIISVRNPSNNHAFQARVAGKGQVVVIASPVIN